MRLHREITLPLWEMNHSHDRLVDEERMDFTSYKLGYEMKEEVNDPTKMAYKFFSADYYPHGNVTEMSYDPYGLPVALCADFNRSPHCWALAQEQGDFYVVFEEIVSADALTSEQTHKLIDRLKEWGIDRLELYGDNTSNQGDGRYGRKGKNDWDIVTEILKENGIVFVKRLGKQNPKRKVRVDVVNNAIYSGKDDMGIDRRKLLINERCKWVIDDYKYSIVNEDGLKIDSGERGHMSDAVDYWIFRKEKGSRMITYAW